MRQQGEGGEKLGDLGESYDPPRPQRLTAPGRAGRHSLQESRLGFRFPIDTRLKIQAAIDRFAEGLIGGASRFGGSSGFR